MNGIDDSPVPIVFGWGEIDSIGDHLPDGSCFMVTGRTSARQGRLIERIGRAVRGELVIHDGVEPNPLSSTVDGGSVRLRDAGCDFILALGGGSVMDAAKAMAIVASQGGEIMDYLKGRRTPQGLGYPLIAVPTTPGTSSEITPFSIITSAQDRNKLGLRHPSIRPTKALVDPSLTTSLPPDQTASTGLDILAHAMESHWSAKGTIATRAHSLRAISLVRENIEDAYTDGSSRKAREGISLASIHAGMAFSMTGTTICHAISYPITYDTNLPHGMACALSLPGAFELVMRTRPDLAEPIAGAFGTDPVSFPEELRGLMRRMNCPLDLVEAGYSSGPGRILSSGIGPFASNMAVTASEEDVARILDSVSGQRRR